jgi:hypothetical protein
VRACIIASNSTMDPAADWWMNTKLQRQLQLRSEYMVVSEPMAIVEGAVALQKADLQPRTVLQAICSVFAASNVTSGAPPVCSAHGDSTAASAA